MYVCVCGGGGNRVFLYAVVMSVVGTGKRGVYLSICISFARRVQHACRARATHADCVPTRTVSLRACVRACTPRAHSVHCTEDPRGVQGVQGLWFVKRRKEFI